MSGKLYGVGVGPGDPELLTLKAVRVIRAADVIAVPGKNKEAAVAYQIVKAAMVELEDKMVLEVDMPMTKDPQLLERSHKEGAEQVIRYLEAGKNVVFLTLGDPCIYSTYLYLHKRIRDRGFETEIVNGVPSFCAAAAKLQLGLAEKSEMLHIIPASYPIKEALAFAGTKVLMKAGTKMSEVKQELLRHNSEAYLVENCGMDQERIYDEVLQIPEDASYYSLIVIKEPAKAGRGE